MQAQHTIDTPSDPGAVAVDGRRRVVRRAAAAAVAATLLAVATPSGPAVAAGGLDTYHHGSQQLPGRADGWFVPGQDARPASLVPHRAR